MSSSDTMRAHSGRLTWIRLLVFGLLAVALSWAVITHSYTAYLADVDPEAALRLRSNNPTALLGLATSELRLQQASETSEATNTSSEGEINRTSTDALGPEAARSDRERRTRAHDIRAWSERALVNAPLSARGFSVLGQLSEDEAETGALMKAAVDRSLHQHAAVYWMMRESYEKQNFREALRYADTLLRTRPSAIEYVIPVLGKIAEHKDGRGELKEVLAATPPWRPLFFSHLPRAITDARTPLNLLLKLNETSTPPSADDIRTYVSFLIKHKFYDLAYYVWLQFLPAAQLSSAGHLFNGSFETERSGLPFDWTFGEEAGTTIVEKQPRPDAPGQHAMFLEFGPGRVEFSGVRQMILLAPGHYQFQGRQKLDIVSQRGLKWDIRCVDGEQLGASSPTKGSQPEWTQFAFSFSVPKRDCPAQYVQFTFDARSASERFISGTAWYDDLQIEREAGGEAAIPASENNAGSGSRNSSKQQ